MSSDAKLERFLRGAHVFATSIKQILEERLLTEATENRLSFPQYNALRMLQSRTARHVGDVANFLGISYPAASKIVERLHKMGFLTRREDPNDRRASCLTISGEGAALIKRYEAHKRTSVEQLLTDFTAEEIEALGITLERLAEQLLQSEPCYQKICMQCGAYFGETCAMESHVNCAHREPAESALSAFQNKPH